MEASKQEMGNVERAWRWAWRIAVLIVGLTVVLIGVAMIVLPGPAIVVIPLGLAILATEFLFARRWLAKLKAKLTGTPPPAAPSPGRDDAPR